jgi:hypothetical protein
MSTITDRQVYRSRTQSFGILMMLILCDGIVGAGVARNIDRTGVAVAGIAVVALMTAGAWRAAITGVVVLPEGIHVRNIFSNADFRWDEIDRFEIDTADGSLFPQVCRIYTKDGRKKRVFGIQETNVALTRPMESRPAVKMVGELNELLASKRP